MIPKNIDTNYGNIRSIISNTQETIGRAINIHSQNVANAENPKYSTLTPIVGSVPGLNGIMIEAVTQTANAKLFKDLNIETSNTYFAEIISQFYEEISPLLVGSPELNSLFNSNAVYNQLNNFITEISAFNNVAENASSNVIVNKATSLANSINQAANSLYNEQFEIRSQLQNSISETNRILGELYIINRNIAKEGDNSFFYFQQRDEAMSLITDLSKQIPIQYDFTDRGFSIYSNGNQISNVDSYYQLKYHEVTNVIDDDIQIMDSWITVDETIFGTNISTLELGNLVNYNQGVVLQGGDIGGLMNLQWGIIPPIIQSVNTFAANIVMEFNRVHNQGCGDAPNIAFHGTSTTSLNSQIDATQSSGAILFSVLDLKNGLPANEGTLGAVPTMQIRPQYVQTAFGSTPGMINTAALLYEIEQATDLQYVAQMPGMQNIRLGSLFANNEGNIIFDFDLFPYFEDSPSSSEILISISDIKATKPGGNELAIEAKGNATFSMENGYSGRTSYKKDGLYIEIKDSAKITDSITVTASISVTNPHNEATNKSEVSFNIPPITAQQMEQVNGNMNTRYNAIQITGDGVKLAGAKNIGKIGINLSDQYGAAINNSVANASQAGVITIDGAGYGIAFSGDATISTKVNDNLAIKNEGFSYTFGLNNLFNFNNSPFNSNPAEINKNPFYQAGRTLSVSPEISKDNRLFASNKISPSFNNSEISAEAGSAPIYHDQTNNKLNINNYLKIDNNNINIPNNDGTISSTQTTFNNFILHSRNEIIRVSQLSQASYESGKAGVDALRLALSGEINPNIEDELQQIAIFKDISMSLSSILSSMNKMFEFFIQNI